jgi:hypothetical protein
MSLRRKGGGKKLLKKQGGNQKVDSNKNQTFGVWMRLLCGFVAAHMHVCVDVWVRKLLVYEALSY